LPVLESLGRDVDRGINIEPLILVLFGEEIRVNQEKHTKKTAREKVSIYAEAAELTKSEGIVAISMAPDEPLSTFVDWQNLINMEGAMPLLYLGKLTPSAAEALNF